MAGYRGGREEESARIERRCLCRCWYRIEIGVIVDHERGGHFRAEFLPEVGWPLKILRIGISLVSIWYDSSLRPGVLFLL